MVEVSQDLSQDLSQISRQFLEEYSRRSLQRYLSGEKDLRGGIFREISLRNSLQKLTRSRVGSARISLRITLRYLVNFWRIISEDFSPNVSWELKFLRDTYLLRPLSKIPSKIDIIKMLRIRSGDDPKFSEWRVFHMVAQASEASGIHPSSLRSWKKTGKPITCRLTRYVYEVHWTDPKICTLSWIITRV